MAAKGARSKTKPPTKKAKVRPKRPKKAPAATSRTKKTNAHAKRARALKLLGGAPSEALSRPWRVSEDMLAKATDATLKPILRDLLLAEAIRAGCDLSRVRINVDDRAPDDGADAMTPKPAMASIWLGDSETCWQIKVGTAGEPARLKAEVAKPLPSATLRAGGRLVVIATSSTSGEAGHRARLNALVAAGRRAKVPVDRIEVYVTDTLARWLEQHPGIAASFMGFPPGMPAA